MFRAFLMARVKPYLAQTMQNADFGIFEVDSRMGELSEVLHKQLIPDFTDYGLSLERFFVTTIVKPDGDKAYEDFRQIHIDQYAKIAKAKINQQEAIINQQTQAQKMVIESQALATKRAQEGYTYQHERGFDVAEKVAQNEAVGGIANTGIGLGVMSGMVGGMGAPVAGIVANALGAVQPGGTAAPAVGIGIIPPVAGTPPPVSTSSDDMAAFKVKLEKLKMMKDSGILSDAEFEAQKNNFLGSL